MRKELELHLVDCYPSMFRDYGGNPRHTCMTWGCAHGDGWIGILCEMCNKIEEELHNNPELKDDFKFTQVKEKFGTLRVYFNGGNETIYVIVNDAEKKSGRVCEECGTTEDNVSTKGSWIRTLCDPCRLGGKEPVVEKAVAITT